jgi:hypothetical protein
MVVCQIIEHMKSTLLNDGIECFFVMEGGVLKYSRYGYKGVSIKGQNVGFTAKKLQERLSRGKELRASQKMSIK